MTDPRVLVVHSGARHNYALPAIFARAGLLDAFYTDLCAGRGVGRMSGIGSSLPLPGAAKHLMSRLKGRRPPSEVLAKTRTDDWPMLKYELAARRESDPRARRKILAAATQKRGRRLDDWGLGDATHVYNVFGEGGQLNVSANKKGIPVIADMIIALSTRAINLEEFDLFPDWGPAPPDPHFDEVEGYHHDKHLLETTDVFVCPSSFVADDLVMNWGIDRDATRIIPYALSEQWFELKPAPQPGRVLFAGTADRRKGIHYLAKAANLLDSDTAEIRVAGSVSDVVRHHLEATKLRFLGRIPRADMRHEFETADIFVLPTLAEGSATVVYEAMAAGLPVITTRSAGSVIKNGVDGIIIPERNPEALAEQIERLVTDRDLRASLGAEARKSVRKLNWDTYSSALIDVVRATPSPRAAR